jgi:NAD(P)-dependent dehydrogenase (short-subunit alcohol dehydrogenase family)
MTTLTPRPSDAEAHAQFETNFFGPLRLTRLLLPHLRARRAGTILNISSIAGLDAQPACGVYAASKFALEGLSEALAKEVAGLGIDVHVVEPGAFRTRFLSTEVCRTPARGTGEAYEVGPVGRVLRGMREADGRQIGDGDVAARVVFEFVGGEGPVDGDGKKFLRLMLGSDCLRRARIKVDKLDETLRALDGLAQTTDIRE